MAKNNKSNNTDNGFDPQPLSDGGQYKPTEDDEAALDNLAESTGDGKQRGKRKRKRSSGDKYNKNRPHTPNLKDIYSGIAKRKREKREAREAKKTGAEGATKEYVDGKFDELFQRLETIPTDVYNELVNKSR
jgi:hypothetical protein